MKVKRLLAFVLAIAMAFSVAAFSAFAEEDATVINAEFSDVTPNQTEYKAIKRLAELGVLNGYPDQTFRPGDNMSRAEFCTAITRYLELNDLVNENALTGFDDLDTDENYKWARPYVKIAVDRKLVNGFEDKTFRAADQLTYAQAVKMIICAIGYEADAKARQPEDGAWYMGYIAEAQLLKITSNAVVSDYNSKATRATVAMLLYNALSVDKKTVTVGGSEIDLGNGTDQMGRKKIVGIVTGTYLTGLESGESDVESDCIRIKTEDGEEVYTVGFSRNPNDFLGCKVEAYTVEADNRGDYDVCESIEITSSKAVLTIEADCYYGYDAENNTISYSKDRDSAQKDVNLEEDFTVIYNGKYMEDYDLSQLNPEDDRNVFTSGNIELVNNDNDGHYEIVKINRYEVYVVDTPPTRTNKKIKLMYDQTYDGEETLSFPDDSTSRVFYITRDGKQIEPTSLAKWDVLSIKRSLPEAEGRSYYEVIVTRKTVAGTVTERDNDDLIAIDDQKFYIAQSFLENNSEDKPELNPGDNAQVYLDAEGKIVAAAEAKGSLSGEVYGYLIGARQDSDKSEYDLEFWIYTVKGEKKQIGSASKITIDGTRYKATDDDVMDYLADTAETANAAYGGAVNVAYHQPIIYQLNDAGLVSTIYTVNSRENEDISMYLNDSGDGYTRYVPAEERTYSSSAKSFGDFKVSSTTKIIFVPDTRTSTDNYLTFSYSKAFANTRKYIVEAYGMTNAKTAKLVLLYHQNDSRIYTSSTPFMIVASKSEKADGTEISGYPGTSTSLKTLKVSEDDGPSASAIGKGDIIRYILDSSNEIIDYEIWYDASNPDQMQPVGSVSDAIDNRILEIHSTSIEPRKNYPQATFRLQFGTVYDMVIDTDDNVDEKTITVVPTIPEDDTEMVEDGNGVVTRTIGSSVKVFYYDASSRNSDVLTEVQLDEILPYVDYGESATKVITYSSSGTLRMVYILGE